MSVGHTWAIWDPTNRKALAFFRDRELAEIALIPIRNRTDRWGCADATVVLWSTVGAHHPTPRREPAQ